VYLECYADPVKRICGVLAHQQSTQGIQLNE